MNKTMQKVLSIVLATLMCITSLPLFAVADEARQPREWFVSLTGDDVNGNGTIDKPFKTLQKGADMLQAGDTLYIREGVYDEFFKMKSSGTAEAPITIKPYNNEEVMVRATTKLTNWGKAGDNIWVTDMTFDKVVGGWANDCLFNGEESLIVARYPNIPEGGSIMWPELLTMDDADRHSTDIREYGTIWDAELDQEAGWWDGGKVHMHAGLNWFNIIADIDSSEPGILHLKDHDTQTSQYYDEKAGNKYYIKDHIHCLDAEGEYYINYDEKKVYLYSNENPNNLEIGARNNKYVFDLSDVSYVNIESLDIRGAAPKLSQNSHHINFDWISMAAIDGAFAFIGHHNTIKHSHLFDAPYRFFTMEPSDYNAVFNCLIEKTGWMGKGASGVGIGRSATNAYVAYNTIRDAGRTTIAATGSNALFEYNHMYNAGSLTCDTGISYDGHTSAGTSEFRYNWLHDIFAPATAYGLYYDNAHGDVAIHHNVVWDNDDDTGELKVDGWGALLLNDASEGFSVYNNTFIGDASMAKTIGLYNDTRYMNNIFIGQFRESVSHKMQRNNLVGWLDPGFVDMRNYDFTLRPDSIAIDKGNHIDGVTEDYVGEAPDLGAYEYGGEYWIPGHNWENPPEFVHKTPNYIQWHNLVWQPSFEDAEGLAPDEVQKARMWDPKKYGWSIMKETEGIVTQEFLHSLDVLQGVRRNGNNGVKLGDDLPTTYPGDEVADLSTSIIKTYKALTDGLVNYSESKTETMYEKIPEALYNLMLPSTNMTPKGDFEDSSYKVASESAIITNTDEDAYSGTRSLKVENMKYSWSGVRQTLPATGDRRFRVSLKIKGQENATFQYRFVDHHPTDWTGANDRVIGDGHFQLSDDEWQTISLDVDTKGATKGIRTEMYYGNWQTGYYYIDDLSILDITELYLMQEACASNIKARTIIDNAINNRLLTVEGAASAMRSAAEIILKDNKDKAVELLVPILTTLRNAKLSPGAGITYTVDTIKPGKTYKLMCHAWVTNPLDKVQFVVKDGDNILAQWETNAQKWTDEFITFVAPENGNPVTIEIWKPQGIGSAHVDDVTVREYDPVEYKLRSGSKYIENNELDYGELWPWYSFDGDIELVPTDKGTSLKVTNGRAMQDVRTLPAEKSFFVSADVKLAMPGVASKEAEINLHVLETNSNGTYVTYPIAKEIVTNDKWTHIEGIFEVPTDLRYGSMGYTVGLVGDDGVFYLDNANIEEMPMPTMPGTGDNMTFEEMMADTKNWVSTSGDQGLSITDTSISTTNGNIGYRGKTQRDFRITFEMMIEGFADGDYPSLTIRNGSAQPALTDGYTIIFKKDNIELQKYGKGITSNWLFVGDANAPTGIYGPAVFSDAFKMGEWNTITIGSTNEEKGVRIYFEVNGEVYYDYLDTVSTVDYAGYLAFCRNGVDRIQVRTVQK